MNIFHYQYRFLWIALGICAILSYPWHIAASVFSLSWWYYAIGVVCIFGFMTLHRFILQPCRNKRIYNDCPWLARYFYNGNVNKMRKFRITLEAGWTGKTYLKIGYIQFGGYFFFEILEPTNNEVVFETYLGFNPCEFLFLSEGGGPIKNTELLPEDSNAVPNKSCSGHWWQ